MGITRISIDAESTGLKALYAKKGSRLETKATRVAERKEKERARRERESKGIKRGRGRPSKEQREREARELLEREEEAKKRGRTEEPLTEERVVPLLPLPLPLAIQKEEEQMHEQEQKESNSNIQQPIPWVSWHDNLALAIQKEEQEEQMHEQEQKEEQEEQMHEQEQKESNGNTWHDMIPQYPGFRYISMNKDSKPCRQVEVTYTIMKRRGGSWQGGFDSSFVNDREEDSPEFAKNQKEEIPEEEDEEEQDVSSNDNGWGSDLDSELAEPVHKGSSFVRDVQSAFSQHVKDAVEQVLELGNIYKQVKRHTAPFNPLSEH